jgi:hypothetical protein
MTAFVVDDSIPTRVIDDKGRHRQSTLMGFTMSA